MDAIHHTLGGWFLMAHGSVFGEIDAQRGPRGGSEFDAPNWFMGEAAHPVGGGVFRLRAMMSADPWTVRSSGYPLLLQTGEAFQGGPLYDRQHPHDLFMELAASYAEEIWPGLGLSAYAGPVGEPALGPVAFPHRPSAEFDPAAPLGHHWQDATHIAFGVATVGAFTRTVRFEGSIFNGREPDENRTTIDFGFDRFDSWSVRATVNPAAAWSLSAWYGYLKDVEPTVPGESMHRFGASVLQSTRLGEGRAWASALIYGANEVVGSGDVRHSLLLESTYDLDPGNTVFGRAEYVRKGADDLGVLTVATGTAFDVGAVALGFAHTYDIRHVRISAGARGAVDFVPETLRPFYGSSTPVGAIVFVRLLLTMNRMMADMGGMTMD
jgi:hypothetical protein